MTSRIEQLLQDAEVARRDGRSADARRDLTEAVALARLSPETVPLPDVLTALARLERGLGRTESALALYEEAAALYRAAGEALHLASAIRHLGDIHLHHGSADLAVVLYEEALTIYRGHAGTRKLDLANALRPFAILKEASGDLLSARQLWSEARDLYAAVSVQAGVDECDARLAALG